MERMDAVLKQFLNKFEPVAAERTVWGNGRLPLRVHFYCADTLPPLDFITSVRAILLRGEEVMVVHDGVTPWHVIPGGRRENGETITDTLRRELLEETGWIFTNAHLIGFIHYHHLAPKPDDYPFPCPDFLQIVFVAEAGDYVPDQQVVDEYELDTGFQPITAARTLIDGGQLVLLDTAVTRRDAHLTHEKSL